MKRISGALLAFVFAAVISSPASATLQNNLDINGMTLDASNAPDGFAIRDDQNNQAGVWFLINGDDLGIEPTTRVIVNNGGVLSIKDPIANTLTPILTEDGPNSAANTILGNLEAQTAVNSNVDPDVTDSRDIGDNDLRWRNISLSDNVNIGDDTTNGNLSFNTVTDQFEFDKGVNITSGDLIVNGTTIIGNGQFLTGANQNLSNLNGQTAVNSNVDPAVTGTTDLGDNDLRWRNISLSDNVNIGDDTTNGNLSFNTGTDQFEFDKGVNISGGDLIVNGVTIINENGQLLAGADQELSNLAAQTAVNSDIDPATTAATNIGDNDLRWLDLFLSRNINIGDDTTNGNLTFNTGTDQFEFDKGVNITSGDLIVNGTTIINENGQFLVGANQNLSNLNGQTAVNSNIDPAATASTDLGDDALRWRSISLSDNVNIGEPGNNGNLTFNTTNNRFEFDRDVHVNENLTVNGTVNNVDINNLETSVNNNTQNINNLIGSVGIRNGQELSTLTNAVPTASLDLTGLNIDHIDIVNFIPEVTIDIANNEIRRGALDPVTLSATDELIPNSNVNVRFESGTNTLIYSKDETTGIDSLDQEIHSIFFQGN